MTLKTLLVLAYSDNILSEPCRFLLGHLRFNLDFHALLINSLLLQNLTLLSEVIDAVLLLAILDVFVHLLVNLEQALLVLHLSFQLNSCGRLRIDFLGPGLVLSLIRSFLEQCPTLHMLLAKPIHLLLFLIFHALSDLVRLGSIDFLGIFNACMHPRREHVIVESAHRLRCMLFVLWSAISQLFDKILSVIHICNLFLFL